MKTIVTEKNESPVINFPYLAKSKHTGGIVLFTSYRSGTVVAAGTEGTESFHSRTLGYYSHNWDVAYFDYFKGSICLQND